ALKEISRCRRDKRRARVCRNETEGWPTSDLRNGSTLAFLTSGLTPARDDGLQFRAIHVGGAPRFREACIEIAWNGVRLEIGKGDAHRHRNALSHDDGFAIAEQRQELEQ